MADGAPAPPPRGVSPLTPSPAGDDEDQGTPPPQNDGDSIIICNPPTPPPRVPTAPTLRMLLGVLKHRPAGVLQDVGVQLMVFASAIEVTRVPTTTTTTTSQARARRGGGGGGGGGGRGAPPQPRQQREERAQIERRDEAEKVLTLARQGFRRTKRPNAENSSGGVGMGGRAGKAGKVVAAPGQPKRPQRLRRQTTANVAINSSLQGWATRNARNIAVLRAVLEGFSSGVEPADACMVRDCTARIPARSAVQALPEAGVILEFIAKAVEATTGDMAAGSAGGREGLSNVNEGEKQQRVSKDNATKRAAASSDDRRGPPAEGRGNAVMKTSGSEKPAASSPQRDPLGDILLVTEDGKHNLWDDIVVEQLAKCLPVAFLPQHALDVAPHVTIPDGTITVTRPEEKLLQNIDDDDDDDDKTGVQHILRPDKTAEAGMSAASGPKDNDVAHPPSRCQSEQQPVVAYSSRGAPPLGVKKAVEVEPAAGVDLVTPETTSGRRETPSGGADSAALAADSAAVTADFPALVANSAALATDSAALSAEYVAPAAVDGDEDRAPFPGAHPRPVETGETGVSAAVGLRDDDVTPALSLCRSEEEPVVANNSNVAPLGVKKAVEVGPSTGVDPVTPQTASGPTEISSGGTDAAALASDSAALTTDFAAPVAGSAALVADSAVLAVEHTASVAVVAEEDRAPFPGAHSRPFETEEAGVSAAAGPKNDDIAPPPSLFLSEGKSVVAYNSNGAPLEAKETEEAGHLTEPDPLTPGTTPGPKEVSSGSADSAALSADSAAPVVVAVDLTAAAVAIAAGDEDQASFPSAPLRAAKAEEAGMPAAAEAAKTKDDDATPSPSFCLSAEEPIVAHSSNDAPLDVRKAAEVEPATVPNRVTPATTPGRRETSGPRRIFSGGAGSAALGADSAAGAAAVAAEKYQAPFPSAHSRPSTRIISVQSSTPVDLDARRMGRRAAGVGRPSKGFRSGYEKEKRSSSRECRPLEVNAPSITHRADDGVLPRGASGGKMGREGSRGGGLKGRCAVEERAARGGSGMAAEKNKKATKGGSAGGAPRSSRPPPLSTTTQAKQPRKAQTGRLPPPHEQQQQQYDACTSTRTRTRTSNVACGMQVRRETPPPLSSRSWLENGTAAAAAAAAVPMAGRPTPAATAAHHRTRSDRFEGGASSGQRRRRSPAEQRTRSGGGGGGARKGRLEWGVHVRREIGLVDSDSWFFVPLLLEALGVSHRCHDGFERPERWSVFVDRYRDVLRNAGVSADGVIVWKKKGTYLYINPHVQERLMALDPTAAYHIGMWIVKVRYGGAWSVVPPLPEIDLAAEMDSAAWAFAFE